MLRLMEYAHPHALDCSVILASKQEGELVDALEAIAVPVYQTSGINIFHLIAVLQKLKPDVLYLFGVSRSLMAGVAGKLVGIQTIISAERSSVSRLSDRIIRRFDKKIVDGYICNTVCAAHILHHDFGIANERLHTVYNGISEPSISVEAAELPVEFGEGPFIVCVANIRELKGQHILLEAVYQLQREFPQLRALLVGKDATQGAFFAEAAAKGLDSTYHWVGFAADVRPYLQVAQLFVLPSLYYEGTPTSILEAMQLGIPVVASDVGGVSELVQNNRTGLLVKPNDVEQLAQKIRSLLVSESFRKEMSDHASQHVLRNHSLASMLEGHQNAFYALGLCQKTASKESK